MTQPLLPRFSSHCQADKFNESQTFKEYHHYEKYDPTKIYPSESFEHDYGHGKLRYEYKFYDIILYDPSTDSTTLQYIIADEKINDDELMALAKYCRCQKCTAKWYDLLKHFICGCCIGCLNSDFPQQRVINSTRKYLIANNINCV